LDDSSAQEQWPGHRARGGLVALAAVVGAVVVVLAARIFADGYGADNDTWLMLGTWDVVVDQQRYVPSRAPGYVLAEMTIGALADVGGHWLSNAVSLVLGAGTLVLSYGLVRRRTEDGTSAGLLVAVLALTPAFVIAATTSIDYLYGLFFFLAGWWTLERGRPTIGAALLLGISGAARLSYAPLGLIVLLLGPGRDRSRRERVAGAGVLAATTAVAYALPWRFYGGLDFLRVDRPSGQGIAGIAGRALLKGGDVLGLLGSAVGIVVLVLALRTARGGRRERWLLAIVGVQLLVWLWLPAEPSYLLPALAALLVWVARPALDVATRWALVVLAATLAVYALVDPRLVEVDHANRYGYDTCDATEATGARWHPHVRRGPLLDYPATSDALHACNEQQRAGMLTRGAP
jgi:hypothetical protein